MICVTNICVTPRKQTGSFRIAGSMLAIAPLWLMLAAANTLMHAQTTSSPADWTQFLRDNMQRWNPYETALGVNNVGALNLKWSFTTGNEVFSSPAVVNEPTLTTVHQGDLLTYAFPIWNLGPSDAVHEVLNTQVPAGTTFDYIRISGTPGLGTCTTPPYQGTGQIVCNENAAMAPNTTWTVRLTVKVTAPAGTVITESAATMADTPDPNLANNTATVSLTVQ
jgi:hypothetical protein